MSKASAKFTMQFADAAIEAAVKQAEKNARAQARIAFEHGFRLGEMGTHNLQSAMATYDKMMGETPKEVGPLGTEIS